MSERIIQREIVKQLRKLGYTVWVTSTYRSARNTVGTPDLFVSIGGGRAMCLEVKDSKGKHSKEQANQDRMGLVVTVRSVEDALQAVLGEK